MEEERPFHPASLTTLLLRWAGLPRGTFGCRFFLFSASDCEALQSSSGIAGAGAPRRPLSCMTACVLVVGCRTAWEPLPRAELDEGLPQSLCFPHDCSKGCLLVCLPAPRALNYQRGKPHLSTA